MGQDTSCGICGKHYQNCEHYIKEHIPTDGDKTLCGRQASKVAMLPKDWEQRDCDPDDICKVCMKKYGGVEKYERILYGEDMMLDEADQEYLELAREMV